jgi:PilZ domain-containing protein
MTSHETDPAVRPPFERRRHPRIAGTEIGVSVPSVTSVEVLDLGAGGALLSTESALQVGQRAHLRTLLAREPFAAWVEVLSVDVGTINGSVTRHRLGVTFTAMDDHSRQVLQRFVKDDSRV